MNEWGRSHHLPSPTVGELPTMGVWSALDHVTWVVASSQIQIQQFKGAGVKWVEKLQDAPSVDCTEIHPSVECFPVYPSGLTDSLLQRSAVLHAYWATAWTQPSGPWKGPWSPGWMVIVSRSVLTASQASELIKTPKGSNPWMPLRDLQLLLFMN